jgi:hypothetical protein
MVYYVTLNVIFAMIPNSSGHCLLLISLFLAEPTSLAEEPQSRQSCSRCELLHLHYTLSTCTRSALTTICNRCRWMIVRTNQTLNKKRRKTMLAPLFLLYSKRASVCQVFIVIACFHTSLLCSDTVIGIQTITVTVVAPGACGVERSLFTIVHTCRSNEPSTETV